MRKRSTGIAAVTMVSSMAGVYCFLAGVALLVGGNVASRAGSDLGSFVLGLGALFLVMSAAAPVVAGGLWLRRPWAWPAAVLLFAAVLALNVFLSVIAANFINLILPIAGTAVVLAILSRPAIKAAFMPQPARTLATLGAPTTIETISSPG